MTGPITKADAGGLEAVISTPRVDLDGESVDPLGLRNREAWLTNPLIFWAHEWARNPSAEPIGKGTRLDVAPVKITSAAVYAPTAKAQNIRALVLGRFVSRTSIGFDPIEMADIKGIPTHTAWNLLEWSIVPMPANTEAAITGVKSALRWLADEVAEPVAETSAGAITTLDPAAVEALVATTVAEHLTLHHDAVSDTVQIVEARRVIVSLALPRPRRVAFLP